MSDFEYLVGDQFEGSPIEIGRWIGVVSAAGGTFDLDKSGSVLTITSLPPQPKAPVPLFSSREVILPTPEPEMDDPSPFIEAILEVPTPEELPNISPEQTVYEKNNNLPVPEVTKPVRKPRTPKTAPSPETTEE